MFFLNFILIFIIFSLNVECSQKCIEKSFNITVTRSEVNQNNITLFYSIKTSLKIDNNNNKTTSNESLSSIIDLDYANKCLKSIVVQYRPINDDSLTIIETSFQGNMLNSFISITNLTFLSLYYFELSYIQYVNDDLIVEMNKLTNFKLGTCFGKPSRPSNINVISFTTNNTINLSWNSSMTTNSPFICYYELTIIDFINSNITVLDLDASNDMKYRFDSMSQNTTIYLSAVNDRKCYMNNSNLMMNYCKIDRLTSDFYMIVYTGNNITFSVSSIIPIMNNFTTEILSSTSTMTITQSSPQTSSSISTEMMSSMQSFTTKNTSFSSDQTMLKNNSNRILYLNELFLYLTFCLFVFNYDN